jgi:hypothetical protein
VFSSVAAPHYTQQSAPMHPVVPQQLERVTNDCPSLAWLHGCRVCVCCQDGNGEIDLKELGIVMRSLGYSPTDKQLRDMLDRVRQMCYTSIMFKYNFYNVKHVSILF